MPILGGLQSRQVVLRQALGLVATAIVAITGSFAPNYERVSAEASSIRLANGGDVSWLPAIEREGSKFRSTTGRATEPLKLMKSAGLEVARIRLWVNPPSQDSSLEQVLKLAKRAKLSGLSIVLDLHYSDWWADPANQKIPSDWDGLSLAGLSERVGDYTTEVLQEFVAQGTPPTWVQVGNEIGNGLLWPTGSLANWSPERFSAMVSLLNAGSAAVRATSPKSRVMIHLETGGDATKTRNWLRGAFAAGLVSPDGIGLSYYSIWSGPLSNLEASLKVVAQEFKLTVAIAETAYPNSSATVPKPLLDPAKSRLAGYSLSASGQAAYATRVANVLRASAGTRAIGVWWWEVFSPNASKLQDAFGPSLLGYSSLVTGSGTPNRAMISLGKASR